MTAPIERTYELALRALEEQERRVEQARASVPPLLAAAGIALSLLTAPAFAGKHPEGLLEVAAVSVGVLGAAIVVAAGTVLLRPTRVAFNVDAQRLLRALDATAATGEWDFYANVADAMAHRRADNEIASERLLMTLDVALTGLLLELLGLALGAALAS